MAVAFFGLAPVAQARDWGARAACDIETSAVNDLVMPPKTLARLRDEAAQIPNARGAFWTIPAPEGGVSHLWGKMHSSDLHLLDLPAPVRSEDDAARYQAYRATGIALYLPGETAGFDLWDRAEMMARFADAAGAALIDPVKGYLLDERNLDFLDMIRDDLHEGGVLMAIGSSHLSGKTA